MIEIEINVKDAKVTLQDPPRFTKNMDKAFPSTEFTLELLSTAKQQY